MKQIRYNYYFSLNNELFKLVTKSELINKLAPYVTTIACYTPIGSVEMTDLKKINSIIKKLQKGTHYNIISDNYSIRMYAQKRGDE